MQVKSNATGSKPYGCSNYFLSALEVWCGVTFRHDFRGRLEKAALDLNVFPPRITRLTRYQTCAVAMIQSVLAKTAKIMHVISSFSENLQSSMNSKTTSYESDSLRNWRFSWLQCWTPRKQAVKVRISLLAVSPRSPLARALYLNETASYTGYQINI